MAVLFMSAAPPRFCSCLAASPQHMMIGPANRGDATREQLKGD